MSEASILAHILMLKSRLYEIYENTGATDDPSITPAFISKLTTRVNDRVSLEVMDIYESYIKHMKMIGAL